MNSLAHYLLTSRQSYTMLGLRARADQDKSTIYFSKISVNIFALGSHRVQNLSTDNRKGPIFFLLASYSYKIYA